MTPRPRDVDVTVRAAAVCSFALIAHQVASKAVRDALFLSSFPVTALPRIVIGSALVTIAAVLLSSRALARFGPGRLLPGAFATSAAIQLGIWPLVHAAPRAAAVLFYLHASVVGALLISWFWSMLNECLDPNTARKRIGRIAGAGTLGGLLGGLAAERVGAMLTTSAMLPILAGLHAMSAALAFAVPRSLEPERRTGRAEPHRSGFEVLKSAPYLRDLALLVLTGTVSAALLDYVFKARAAATFAGGDLLRFFGLFYTAVGLATFLVQSALTRRLLARGLARTASTLPGVVALGGAAAIAAPGLAAAAAARGLEASVRSSLFRSSYELFYNPIRRADKRAAKTLVDVGFDRLGDAVGGGLVQLVLFGGIAVSSTLLALAIALGAVGLLVARRLHQGYVTALEASLLDQGAPRAKSAEEEAASRSAFLSTVAQIDLAGPLPDLAETAAGTFSTAEMSHTAIVARVSPSGAGSSRTPTPSPAAAPAPARTPSGSVPLDPVMRVAMELRSGDASRARRALATLESLPRELVPIIIQLLAWDPVAPDALRTLRASADRHVGALVDALGDPNEEFSVRRRVARVLAASCSERAVRGLLAALGDPRFEVRFQAGAALARLHERSAELVIDRAAVLAVIEREASVNRQVWESNRLLDELGHEESPFYDDVLRARASRSLEHVFNVLSLVYPKEPLRIAYRGLHASDPTLRGTALEYLEQVLPPRLRESLWPFLDDDRKAAPGAKTLDEVVDSLMRSHESIQLDLEKLRRGEG